MRKENELNVDVHARAIRAAERTSPNGRLQGLMDESSTERGEPWWVKYKERWFKWERNLIVAGKVIEKGWVVPQPLGIALLLVILGGVGGLYWRIIDKQSEQDRVAASERAKQSAEIQELNKLLIRLDQRLIDKDKADAVQQQKTDSRLDSVEAWQDVTNKDLARLVPRKR